MKLLKRFIFPAVLAAMFLFSACSPKQTFKEAHDAFATKLTEENNDGTAVPAPPEGVFTLDYYDTEAGKLAAYVSSDPGDGKKHPLVIWVVGGWSSSIDEFPWSYGEWENDQTGAAFREAGMLMMYPSFRGANGNPGYFEALFGEVNDIVSAYEYAAALPFVDPERIYLVGHSTGGTRALLAAEYADVFRATVAFGAVDDIRLHNHDYFTFDVNDESEVKMRSPIHWLDDIKTPTFVVEGETGNSLCVENMKKASSNPNLNCYVMSGEDHFTALAPLTRFFAEKFLADTGAEVNITVTQEELDKALEMTPVEPMPIMTPFSDTELGLDMLVPVVWGNSVTDDGVALAFMSEYENENFWDASAMYAEVYSGEDEISPDEFAAASGIDTSLYQPASLQVNGRVVYVWDMEYAGETNYFYKMALFQNNGKLLVLDFWTPDTYREPADALFTEIIRSVNLV